MIDNLKKHIDSEIEGYKKTFPNGSHNQRIWEQWKADIEKLENDLASANKVVRAAKIWRMDMSHVKAVLDALSEMEQDTFVDFNEEETIK